ncbi:MAG TPA: hypothetical protein VGQ83_27360 [Polyangia bacterium]|jgi:hypothetical protein
MASTRARWRALALLAVGLAGCGGSRAGAAPDAAPTTDDAGVPAADAGDPNQPPAGFLDPTSPSYLALSFKGLINSQDTVTDDPSNLITGIGHLLGQLPARTFELTDSDGMLAYSYTYPADYPNENVRGKTYLVVDGSRAAADATATRGTMTGVSVYFDRDAAQALDGASHRLGKVGAQVYDFAYVVRKDSAVLRRTCYVGLADAGAAGFLDHAANQTFAPGENLILWANVPLVTDQQTLIDHLGARCTRYQGAPCECALDDTSFDCAEWDVEAAKDGSDLSCSPPADFLSPPASGDYATFKFKGLIEPASNPSPLAGYVEATVSVGGRAATASMFGYAIEYGAGTADDVLQVSFYDQQQGSGGTIVLRELSFIVTPAALVQAQSTGTNPVVSDASTAAFGLASTLTAYPSGGSYVYRVCPSAVFRPGETAGSFYDCPAANTTFAAGEHLEIEGNLALATNVTADDVGVPLEADGCYCSTDTAVVACATLPSP